MSSKMTANDAAKGKISTIDDIVPPSYMSQESSRNAEDRSSSTWIVTSEKGDRSEKPTVEHIQLADSIRSVGQGESRSFRENILSLYHVWYWELLSAALSFATFIAIVAVLATQDGRPVPNWPSPITVNSLIASFTVVFKAALIMPLAEGVQLPSIAGMRLLEFS